MLVPLALIEIGMFDDITIYVKSVNVAVDPFDQKQQTIENSYRPRKYGSNEPSHALLASIALENRISDT